MRKRPAHGPSRRKHLHRRVAQEAWKLLDRVKPLADPSAPAVRSLVADCPGLLGVLARGDGPAAAPTAWLFAPFAERARTVARLRDQFPSALARARETTTRAMRGRFTLLGYSDLHWPDPIDWQRDAVSGRSPPLRHWSRYDHLRVSDVGDVKVTWELNRHQYLVAAGLTYAADGDEGLARWFVSHVEQWLATNPYGMGLNWASALEVALRSIAWIWAAHFFGPSPSVPASFWERYAAALVVNAGHVRRFLSHHFSPNTHLTGEALGLLYIGAALGHAPYGRSLQHAGLAVLETEFETQVQPDGTYFEHSAWYQRYTAEFALHTMLLAQRVGLAMRPAATARMHESLRALADLHAEPGRMLQLGDEDGGRLLPMYGPVTGDPRPTLAAAGVVFGDAVLAREGDDRLEEALWLLGTDELERARPEPAAFERTSKVLPSAGLVLMREGSRRTETSCVFDAGPLDFLTGAHAHADALAVWLSMDGRPVLVDAGTGSYVGRERALLRGTSSHNTLSIEGAERGEPAGPFSWRTRLDGAMVASLLGPVVDFAEGVSDLGAGASGSVRHRRRVLRAPGGVIVIVDDVEAQHAAAMRLHFHLAARWRPQIDSPTRATLVDEDRVTEVSLTVIDGAGQLEIVPVLHSPAYGVTTPGRAAAWIAEAGTLLRATTVLHGETALGTEQAWHVLAPGSAPPGVREPGPWDGLVSDARVALVRAGTTGTDVVLLDATYCRLDGCEWRPPSALRFAHVRFARGVTTTTLAECP